MRNIWKFLFGFLFVLVIAPQSVLAQEKIDSFDTNIVAHQDGMMTVVESITYDFGEEDRHGIFRDIPLVSRVGDLFRVVEIDVEEVKRDGEDEPFEVENMPKETSVKIGDPDEEISGKHNYIIIYTVKNGIGSNYETHDEIYWNGTGNEWDVPIEKASYKVGTDFGTNVLESVCYTGPVSSKFQNCRVNGDSVITTQELSSRQGLTVASKFPVNTFPDSVLRTSEPVFDPDFINLLKFYLPIVLFLNLLLAPYLLFKYFTKWKGKSFGSAAVMMYKL